MFQAIKLTEDDVRYHRFLFRKSLDEPIQVFELTTVTFSDKSSPTAAAVALRHVAKEHALDDPEIQQAVFRQFYVDDLNDSRRSVKEGIQLKSGVTSTLAKGNFAIRNWLSKKKEICDPDCSPPNGNAVVLGTCWNIAKDTLSVKEVVSV
jgi:hypothetical protein